jgi:hypothetical protein
MKNSWPRAGLFVMVCSLTSWVSSSAQVPASVLGQVPGGCVTPAAERTSEIGCYLTATEPLGALPQRPLFWHLCEYSSHASAQAARGPHGTVVESLGKIWLYTIAESMWRPSSGKRIAVIGPLGIRPGTHYVAWYMEAVFPPEIESRNLVHRHAGPEAWYVLTGAQCLETPDGATVVRAGHGSFVREGPPMSITAVGSDVRRSVALVLNDASRAWTTMANDWQPKGLCQK